MDVIVRKAEQIPLTDSDIKNICQNDVLITTYWNFRNMKNTTLMDLFRRSTALVIFYSTMDASDGHWSTLIYNPTHNTIEHFDSYGLSLDQILAKAEFDRNRSGGHNFLKEAIQKAVNTYGSTFIENRHAFQVTSGLVNTCGRYASVRARFKDLPLNLFAAMLTNQKIPADMIVTYMTILFTTNRNALDSLTSK